MARRPVSMFEQMFKKKVLPKKKQLEMTDSDTVLDITTYRLVSSNKNKFQIQKY